MDQKEIKKYFELNDNKKQTCQCLWNAVEVLLREKFTALIVYMRKEEGLKFKFPETG